MGDPVFRILIWSVFGALLGLFSFSILWFGASPQLVGEETAGVVLAITFWCGTITGTIIGVGALITTRKNGE